VDRWVEYAILVPALPVKENCGMLLSRWRQLFQEAFECEKFDAGSV